MDQLSFTCVSMVDRLPPLKALRAFEAAARHKSFAKAADELFVTPAALSFQIKNLEQHLGQPLFHRLNRAVSLTEAGRALSPGATDGFETLATAWRAALKLQDNRTLVVTAGPAFTAKWLAPRLFAFAAAHPEIELRFTATLRQLDFQRDEVDVAIRYGYGSDEGLHSEHLMDEAILPVMRPDMAERFPTVKSLCRAPLLHDESVDFLVPPANWDVWFRANKIGESPTPAARFSQADHAIDAALAGAGIVLTRTSLAAQYLATGQLVAPFPIALTTQARFRFLCAKGTETRKQVSAFHDWLLMEIRKIPNGLENRQLMAADTV